MDLVVPKRLLAVHGLSSLLHWDCGEKQGLWCAELNNVRETAAFFGDQHPAFVVTRLFI